MSSDVSHLQHGLLPVESLSAFRISNLRRAFRKHRLPRSQLLSLLGAVFPILVALYCVRAQANPPTTSHYLSQQATSLTSASSHTKFAEASVTSVLHSTFFVPQWLSVLLSFPDKLELLTQLQSRNKLENHVIVAHVVGSNMTARLGGLSSALSYSRLMNRILIILWDIDSIGEDVSDPPSIISRKPIEKEAVFFVAVNNFALDDGKKDSSGIHVDFWSEPGPDRFFDTVTYHRDRHLFLSVSAPFHGRYVQHISGIERLSALFTPSPSMLQAFSDFVSPWTFPHLTMKQVSDQLHRLYSVPLVFLSGMTDSNLRRLLRLLDESKSKRILFLHAQFGLGNRLRALGSAMAVAKVTGRVFVAIWVPDQHLLTEFNDLFANDLVVLSKFSMEWPPSAMHSNDRALTTVDFYNFMHHEGNRQVHNPSNVYVDPRKGRHLYVKTAYVVKSTFTPRIISYTSAYWNTMREALVPVADVMAIVERPDLENVSGMLGVHIRARRIENDIKGVSQEFYGKGSLVTDYWRNRTGYNTFAAKISSLPSKYKYFVAADTPEAIVLLEQKFGSHRIYSAPQQIDCLTRSVNCVKFALADIILLSKTRVLLGSHWSSFTEAAVRLSGHLRVHLAGVHFGTARGPNKK